MHLLNLFLIPIILISLFSGLRFSYLIALIVSLAAATFIFAGEALPNLLLSIATFNLAPLACRNFRSRIQRGLSSLRAEKDSTKADYEKTLKEHSLAKQSNAQLNAGVSHIVELYKVTRAMSCLLRFEEIFEIFSKKLMEDFRFKRSRLILIDEAAPVPAVKAAYQLKYGQDSVEAADAEAADTEILKESLAAPKPVYLEPKQQILAPLADNGRRLGALAVEGLSPGALENFSILTNQFSLEFKRVKLYQRVQELAITDGLSGLFVRRYFLERLKEEIERSQKHNFRLSFLMLDIDHFKQCNDKFGHLTGDVVLKEVAAKIKACVREIDLTARYGGEEFSVLLPDTGKAGARGVAERIRATVAEQAISAYDETLEVKISIGVAAFPEDSTALRGLIDKADKALYRAKQEGRNRVCVFKG